MVEFTVLIPVFNTPAQILREALESIQSQTVQPKQVIIIDDGSKELDTLHELAKWESHFYVHYLDKNGGVSHALNVGHGLAQTEWIALMGSDDVSLPYRFERQVNFISKHPHADVVGAQLKAFFDHDPTRKSIYRSTHPSKPKLNRRGQYEWQTNHGTVFYKNSAVKSVGGYNVDKRKGQDVDLFSRMLKAGKNFYNISDIVYLWRRYLK